MARRQTERSEREASSMSSGESNRCTFPRILTITVASYLAGCTSTNFHLRRRTTPVPAKKQRNKHYYVPRQHSAVRADIAMRSFAVIEKMMKKSSLDNYVIFKK